MIFRLSSAGILRLGLIPAAAFLLTACEEGTFGSGTAKPEQELDRMQALIEYEERDVEAPEVFQVTDKALWDGRPSLGGVWVAHPDSKQPERVLIVNLTNGKFVVGALFRRETELPGPKLQMSSDAAAALGILAGAPTEVKVTALRRETVQVSVPEEPVEAEPSDGPEKVETTALAAIDAADDTLAEPDSKPAVKTGSSAAKPEAKPAEKPKGTTATTATSLSAPYIQIGFYSIEANAESASADLKKLGIASRIAPTRVKGNTFWRVLAGPAATKAERDKILKSVKGMGYTDAYAVKG
jgi:cell division septation protein DedD